MRVAVLLGCLSFAWLSGLGCGKPAQPNVATGGAPGSGGIGVTGGSPALGGGVATGGAMGSGGLAVTGGAFATGGSIATGGDPATGGMAIGGSGTGGNGPGSGGSGTGGFSQNGGTSTGGVTTGGVATGGMATGGGRDAGVDSPTDTVADVATGGAATGGARVDAWSSNATMAVAIKLTKVEVTQAVSTALGPDSSGAAIAVAARNAKAMEKRVTLVRAHFTLGTGWRARDIEAALYLSNGQTMLVKKTVTANSVAATLASTFNFEFTAEQAAAGLHGQVELHEVSGSTATGTSEGARFPAIGEVDLGLQAGAMEVKVSFVPLTVGGVTPTVTDADIKTVSEWMMSVYPAQKVTITTHAAYDTGFSTFGDAQEEAGLNLCPKLKVGPDAATNLYHVLLVPGSKATVAWDGVGNITDPSANEFSRRCCLVVTDRTGVVGAKALTIAHELGHNHGLEHAPCGSADSPDPAYPYAGGKIGVQGYHIFKKTLIEANTGTDFMGYCDSTAFVSDYFWNQLETRVRMQSNWKHAPLSGRSLSGVFRTPNKIDWVIVRGNLGQPTDSITPTTYAKAIKGAAAGAILPLNIRKLSDGGRLTQVALPLVEGSDATAFDIVIDGVSSPVNLAAITDLSK